jgi:hypothetical protein
VICDGTTERQQVLVSTLGQVAQDAAGRGVRPPAVVVIGEVVRLREALAPDASGHGASGPGASGPEAPGRDALGAA